MPQRLLVTGEFDETATPCLGCPAGVLGGQRLHREWAIASAPLHLAARRLPQGTSSPAATPGHER